MPTCLAFFAAILILRPQVYPIETRSDRSGSAALHRHHAAYRRGILAAYVVGAGLIISGAILVGVVIRSMREQRRNAEAASEENDARPGSDPMG